MSFYSAFIRTTAAGGYTLFEYLIDDHLEKILRGEKS
jgi:hypothetical protein